MNILWLTNIPLPEASQLMNETQNPFGGWLVQSSKLLAMEQSVQLSIAFPKPGTVDVWHTKGELIDYFAFPPISMNHLKEFANDTSLKHIIEFTKPDCVHIFGTEYTHSPAMVNICLQLKLQFVVSIQGLVSVYAHHYMAHLPSAIQNKPTLRDLIKQQNLQQQQQIFVKSGQLEVLALKKARHVIGRTTWDRACIQQINPNAKYHSCNEILREEFYKKQWDINNCEKYSIFISQGSYPIKGLHLILKAMPLILKRFPKAKLYVGGYNLVNTYVDRIKQSSYAKYINQLIKKLNLASCVVSTGILNENKICERYIKSHVFVCPSSIENSPNSLGEAMILGVPCVASYVGGIPDLITHQQEGFLYQSDAPYMLAHYVCEIFSNNDLAISFSQKARERAMKTHDQKVNTNALMNIYKTIIDQAVTGN